MRTENWIKTGGVYLRYELSGQGPDVLVLIHEMGGSLETWDMLMPKLMPICRVLRFDMRGAGLSEKFRGAISLDTLVDDLQSLLISLGFLGPVILIGASFGCAVAIRYAYRYPDQIKAMVLFTPVMAPPVIGVERTLKLTEAIEANGVAPFCDELVGAHYGGPYPPRSEEDKAVVVRITALFAANDPVCLAETWRLMTHLNLEPLLGSIRCPCLVMTGKNDKWRDPEDLRNIADRLSKGEFVSVDAGHYMLFRDVDKITPLLYRFLCLS